MHTILADNRESKLPLWAQRLIVQLRMQLKGAQVRAQAAAITTERNREWFTLRFSARDDGQPTSLFVLSNQGAHPVCSLGAGDVLLVGRAKDAPEKKEKGDGC